ncbi:ABC1 kinase family protein [Evansella tamaricis]|uniref:AarF/ABC1/UbiB kinase family protein n=1 Tax=Evansella tamaricis TaxID=2069301 RepID=A0ABS6JBU8_9BACI|nr:AarF/UbiB family protein [Evansella tamaricis]MBU9711148.1 AarF/ABC1/UbiB kinase family protein [Evansella tamaricis]
MMKKNPIYRISVIIFMFIKFLLQIYLFKKRHTVWDKFTHNEWEVLLKKQASEYREKSLKLEGLMIKVGQFLSTRADILPKLFIEELDNLIDKVPPLPPKVSKTILQKEWRSPIESKLSFLSEEPIASASIGDVYKGTLHNGQVVAIKVQRDQIARIIRTDFKALKIVLWITRNFTPLGKNADLKALYKELVTIISNELDYEKELRNGLYFKEKFSHCTSLHIPIYYEEYSTSKVLVMEWVEGTKITDLSFYKKHSINKKEVAERLFHFFVNQLLKHGTFHADPHPGNILLKKDGTIAVIDFGMVGNLGKEDSHYFRKMIQGFVFGDYDLVIEQLEHLGFLLPQMDKTRLKIILKHMVEAYVNDKATVINYETMENIFQDIQELVTNQPIQLPADYAFLGRAASIALGVLISIDRDINFVELGSPVVEEWLREEEDQGGKIHITMIKDYLKPLSNIPSQLNRWFDSPELHTKMEEQKQWNLYQHQLRLLTMIFTFICFIVSFLLLTLSFWFEKNHLYSLFTLTTGGLFLMISIQIVVHHRWIKQRSLNKRRNK